MASEISANEYPYNLQGDQTKVRQLAAQAEAGESAAINKLRSLGLDASGNLVISPQQQAASSAPTGSAQVRPIPTLEMTQPTRPAAMPTMRESSPATSPAPSANYAAARNPVAPDPFRAQQPFVDPKTQVQRERLELDRAKFEDAQKRYSDQQAAAAARMKAQQEQAASKRPTAPSVPGMIGPSGGGGNPALKGNIKDGIKTPVQNKPAAAGRGRGGGGGGGGGGRGTPSPEQKAREKGRYDRQMDLENRRNRERADRRDREEYAKSRGFNNVRAMEDHDNFQDYLDKNKKKGSDANRTASKQSKNNSPGGDPSYGPGTGGDKDQTGNDAAAAAMYDHLNSLNPRSEDPNAGGGPKMVRAYGNKHAKVWVKARGDFA